MSSAGSTSQRGLRKTRSKPKVNHLEIANGKTDAEFIEEYMCPSENWTQWVHPTSEKKYTLNLRGVARLTDEELETCYNLIEKTSGEDYRNSSSGWHPVAKRKEMRSPGLRYILIQADLGEGNDDSGIRGFMSIMPTVENAEPVVYVYEVHLETELQGTRLGRLLMEYVRVIAENIPSVEKVMLTCFVSNERARRFYGKMGFDLDESSPRDRKLRGGKVVTSDYVILSHRTKDKDKGRRRDL
ncbi:unnamed protein product [Clonostachys rosea]|uniref:N-alpha-acetyltransferase 40 n=1 Tax=Bionectria ochroleuca TaxID=29856 RepID=A0ABY6UHE0_BIOOC|nr:unnamed protein product [Clonostachys rosea]